MALCFIRFNNWELEFEQKEQTRPIWLLEEQRNLANMVVIELVQHYRTSKPRVKLHNTYNCDFVRM